MNIDGESTWVLGGVNLFVNVSFKKNLWFFVVKYLRYCVELSMFCRVDS